METVFKLVTNNRFGSGLYYDSGYHIEAVISPKIFDNVSIIKSLKERLAELEKNEQNLVEDFEEIFLNTGYGSSFLQHIKEHIDTVCLFIDPSGELSVFAMVVKYHICFQTKEELSLFRMLCQNYLQERGCIIQTLPSQRVSLNYYQNFIKQ